MSRLFDRERGARSAALTLAGPRLCSRYPGNVIWGLALHSHTESVSNLMRVGGLLLVGL